MRPAPRPVLRPGPRPARRPALTVARRLTTFDLRRYVIGALLWMPVAVIPLAGGLLLQRLFDGISGQRPAALTEVVWLCAAFVAAELLRGAVLVTAWTYGVYWWNAAATLLRANVLRSIVTARGTRAPRSPAEAVSRLRDDVSDLVDLTDESVPLAGSILFTGGALAVMVTVDPLITLVLVLPMIAIGVLSRLLREVVRRRHRRARELGARVTAFIGELFGGVLAIKTAGAEEAALERLRDRNRARRDAAVKDRLVTDLLDTAGSSAIEISFGLVLLLAAPAMRRGEFTVGDLALFTSYLGLLAQLPQVVGVILYKLPQGDVAVSRLLHLMGPEENAHDLSRNNGVHFLGEPPSPEPGAVPWADGSAGRGPESRADNPPGPAAASGADYPRRPGVVSGADDPRRPGMVSGADGALRSDAALGEEDPHGRAATPGGDASVGGDDPLQVLEARGLTVRDALHGVDLRVPRGSWTVVTGAVGAGKTTLLRALLGLEPLDSGVVLWNGRPVDALVPPRVAYAGQVPRLFSETLRDNVLQGLPDTHLERALKLAAFDDDIPAMPDGLGTMLGPRGVRLSGGQAQRVTAARALVRDPYLLVVDDLSSALDVETERRLWERIALDGPGTLLVVSHRRAVLERADQIVVLDRGRVTGVGPLDDLLRTCPEMRRLWSDDTVN